MTFKINNSFDTSPRRDRLAKLQFLEAFYGEKQTKPEDRFLTQRVHQTSQFISIYFQFKDTFTTLLTTSVTFGP